MKLLYAIQNLLLLPQWMAIKKKDNEREMTKLEAFGFLPAKQILHTGAKEVEYEV